jgi:hypothetical protein
MGGKARAAGMTAKRRKEIAKKAASKRWGALTPKKRIPPTKEEIAKMSEQELYDAFATRYPKNSN